MGREQKYKNIKYKSKNIKTRFFHTIIIFILQIKLDKIKIKLK